MKVCYKIIVLYYFSSIGLVNMRVWKQLNGINYTKLNGNEYGIFSAVEIVEVPSGG